jgi:hypothetical protein
MGYAVYEIGHGRWGGYGVPAYCEEPDCNEEIDRGMAFACGGEPFANEVGCDQYFCEKHRELTGFKMNGEMYPDYLCDHEEDCDCVFKEVCKPCATGKSAYPYKPEHPTWIKHLLTDESWEEWRKNNPEKVDVIDQA